MQLTARLTAISHLNKTFLRNTSCSQISACVLKFTPIEMPWLRTRKQQKKRTTKTKRVLSSLWTDLEILGGINPFSWAKSIAVHLCALATEYVTLPLVFLWNDLINTPFFVLIFLILKHTASNKETILTTEWRLREQDNLQIIFEIFEDYIESISRRLRKAVSYQCSVRRMRE